MTSNQTKYITAKGMRKVSLDEVLALKGYSLTRIARKLQVCNNQFKKAIESQYPETAKEMTAAFRNSDLYEQTPHGKMLKRPKVETLGGKVYKPGDRGFKKLEAEYKHASPDTWKEDEKLPHIHRNWK